MGEVVNKFTGDTKDLEAAYARLQKEVLKVTEEHKKLKKESKDSGDAMKGSIREAFSEVTSLAGGLLSVSAAVGVVNKAYDDWAKNIDELAKKNKDFETGLLKTLQKTGDLAKADQIQSFLGGIKGATREQGSQAFTAISGATPASSLERRKQLTAAIAPLGATGADLAQMGGVAGELSDMMPTKSGGDIADIVAKLQSQTGSDFAKFSESATLRAMQALVTSGAVKSPEEAIGLGVAAHDANLKPEILTNLAEAASKKFDRAELMRPGIGKFSKATPAERMQMLQGDPTIAKQVLGDEAGMKFAMLPTDAAAKRTQELFAAQTGDYARQAVANLEQSSVGLKSQLDQSTAVQKDKNSQGYWASRQSYANILEESLLNSGRDWVARTGEQAAFAFGSGDARYVKGVLEREREYVQSPGGKSPIEGETKRQTEYLERQIRILEKIEANQGRQKNINAHVEAP